MNVKILNTDGLIIPTSAHETDTGLDLVAASEPKVVGEAFSSMNNVWKSVSYIEYDTEVCISPENSRDVGYFQVFPRSSVTKYNLVLKNSVGVIDNAYRNSIKLRFAYLLQPEDFELIGQNLFMSVNYEKIYKKGDKIGQLVASWKEPVNWQVVDSLDDSTRGQGGFGSTGK